MHDHRYARRPDREADQTQRTEPNAKWPECAGSRASDELCPGEHAVAARAGMEAIQPAAGFQQQPATTSQEYIDKSAGW